MKQDATHHDGAFRVHVIRPTAVYTIASATRLLGLNVTTIRREPLQRRLRVAKRAGRTYILGKWLLEWLEAGEVRRPAANGDQQPAGE